MRIALFGLTLWLSCVVSVATAAADDFDDCAQFDNTDRLLRGCTAVIDGGSWSQDQKAAAYHNRGAKLVILGAYAPAIRDRSEAIRRVPGHHSAYLFRGWALVKVGQFQHAVRDLNVVVQQVPAAVNARFLRAQAYLGLGDTRRAFLDYDTVIQLDPDHSLAYMERGLAHFEVGALEHALADFNKSIEQHPDLPALYKHRANIRMRTGHYETAIEDYEQAVRLSTDDPSVFNNRAAAHVILGRYDEAVPDMEAAARLDPSAERWDGLARVRYMAGQNQRALDDVVNALAMDGANVAATDIKAHILAALDRTDEALATFERAATLGGSERVRQYQTALTRHGHLVAVDGAWGPASRRALRSCLEAGCRLLE